MTLFRKRSRGLDWPGGSPDEIQGYRKKRSKIQLEHDNFRSLVSQLDKRMVSRSMVEIFVKMLKSSLFMHDSRLVEIRRLVVDGDIAKDRLKGVRQLLEILLQPPAVHSFLSDMVLMFLKPEEALTMRCFEAYRRRMHAVDVLLKLQQCQRTGKAKACSKAPLKTIRDSEDVSQLDSNSLYDQFYTFLASDSRLVDIISPLFPDQPVDVSTFDVDDMETVTGDYMRDYEADEFEVVNWENSRASELASFRHCACSCHQGATSPDGTTTGHCGLCVVKFYGEHIYVWRGSRLVRGQICYTDFEDECIQKTEPTCPDLVSPSKLGSLGATGASNNSNWECLFRAVDAIENNTTPAGPSDEDTSPLPSSPQVCRKLRFNEDSTQDPLKQAFVETFGRNSWGRGVSPMKRPGPNFAMGGPNDESNSTSYVFVRGFDGANTMLAIAAADSNSATAPLQPGAAAQGPRTQSTVSPVPSASTEDEVEKKEDIWNEDEDRCLLEQFKFHGNVYEAAKASIIKLRKPLQEIRNRLKFLLTLLKSPS